MPDSKFDHAHRANEEVANFITYGDARGPSWLDRHPTDQAKARERLAEWAAQKRRADDVR